MNFAPRLTPLVSAISCNQENTPWSGTVVFEVLSSPARGRGRISRGTLRGFRLQTIRDTNSSTPERPCE